MRLKAALYYAGVAAAVAAALVVTLRLWERRLEVPFGYEGDALFFTVLAKASAQDGPFHFRHLGMPFGVEIADWGAGMPLDISALRGLVTSLGEAGTAINAWWLLSVVATGVFAAFAFRALDFGPTLALGLGYLYALSPYAFYRNVGHVSLVYHFVPLVALLAIRTAEGRPGSCREPPGPPCSRLAAQGLSYIYYSFFSCVLLGAAGLLGWLGPDAWPRSGWPRRASRSSCSARPWASHPACSTGTSTAGTRTCSTSSSWKRDLFALKIRHLLVPIPDHPFAPFRALAAAAADAGFLGDNENAMGQLGTVGSLGFLGLLGDMRSGSAAGLVRGERRRLAAAAALTLVCLPSWPRSAGSGRSSACSSPRTSGPTTASSCSSRSSASSRRGSPSSGCKGRRSTRVRVRPAVVRGGILSPPPPRRF